MSLMVQAFQVDSNASARYVINFQNNITLTGAANNTLNAFNTTSNVTVAGNGFTLNGGDVQRGLFVYSGITSRNTLRERITSLCLIRRRSQGRYRSLHC
jgi:hypothetical protein